MEKYSDEQLNKQVIGFDGSHRPVPALTLKTKGISAFSDCATFTELGNTLYTVMADIAEDQFQELITRSKNSL